MAPPHMQPKQPKTKLSLHTMEWKEVVQVHGSRSAACIKNGRVVSILCGGHTHADEVSEHHIRYSVPDRPVYKNILLALKSSAAEKVNFVVFHKLLPNQWRNLGQFQIAHIEVRKTDVLFNLSPVTPQLAVTPKPGFD